MRFLNCIILIIATVFCSHSSILSDTITRQLNEVVVNGEKPQVKGQDGIMVVDLPTIVEDKPVANILEALSYLPGVVNNNGMIGLAGANDVTIILNGELTNMPVQNLYQLLYTTPIDRLKTVEVMYTAPAKYHVDGAVINIVLKTPKPLDGLQGQVRAGYNQKHYSSFGGGLSATYAVDDWTFDLNYGVSRTKGWNHEESYSNHLYEGKRTMIEDDMRRISESLANTIYFSTKFRNLRLTYNGQITSDAKGWSLSSGTLGGFSNAFTYDGPIDYHSIALRYSAPFGLTVGGDYTYYGETRNQSLTQDDDYIFGSLNRQHINRWHIYADQQHRLGNGSSIMGWSTSIRMTAVRRRITRMMAEGSSVMPPKMSQMFISGFNGHLIGGSHLMYPQRANISITTISIIGISFRNSARHITRLPKAYSS